MDKHAAIYVAGHAPNTPTGPCESSMERNGFLDFSKGILILLVCIGHAIQFIAYQNKGFWLDPVFESIYMFHMPLFMAIAGYLSYRGLTGSLQTPRYLSNRVISYLFPILTWAILTQVTLTFVTDSKLQNLPFAILRNALGGLWFLWALVGSLVITSIALATGKHKYTSAALLFIATLALPDKGTLTLFKYTLPFFLLGFFLATTKNKAITITITLPLSLLVPLLAVASYLCFLTWTPDTYIYRSGMTLSASNMTNILFRWIAGVITSSFSVLLFYYFYNNSTQTIKTNLQKAGRDSIYIYVISSYMFVFAEIFAKRFFLPFPRGITGALTAITIGISIAFLCLYIGRRAAKNPVAGYVLFGRRPPRPRSTPLKQPVI